MSEQTFHIPDREGSLLTSETDVDLHKANKDLIPYEEVDPLRDALRYAGVVEIAYKGTPAPVEAARPTVYDLEAARAAANRLSHFRQYEQNNKAA